MHSVQTATACASLELWNEKMLRWVNRGARGIALFDETWQNTKLRYVFDISDTHMVAGGRSPYLWKMQEHQREEILTHLAEVYALEEKDTATLQDALMAVAREMVNDNYEIAMSCGLIEGDKVTITDGPLAGKEAMICKINRHKRTATLNVEMFGDKLG